MVNTEAVDVALLVTWWTATEVRSGRVDANSDVAQRLADGGALVHVLAAFAVVRQEIAVCHLSTKIVN